jgi:hypothetical protein
LTIAGVLIVLITLRCREGTRLKSKFVQGVYVLDEIPFEERRVISELVELWQTGYEPGDLSIHIDRLSRSSRNGMDALFFQQVYANLRADKLSEYVASSASEFQRFLEDEYHQQAKIWNERQARAEVEEREKSKRRARADFDAFGKEMAKATTRAELVELGWKRAALAPHTGIFYVYENHSWNCKKDISSDVNARCPDCGFYICSSCFYCMCGFDWYETSPF